jgi:hypothetical protein
MDFFTAALSEINLSVMNQQVEFFYLRYRPCITCSIKYKKIGNKFIFVYCKHFIQAHFKTFHLTYNWFFLLTCSYRKWIFNLYLVYVRNLA